MEWRVQGHSAWHKFSLKKAYTAVFALSLFGGSVQPLCNGVEAFLKSQPYLHSQMWLSLVAILLHLCMEYNWNDVFIAIPHDTNSHWWRLTWQFLPWTFSVAHRSHCAIKPKPFCSKICSTKKNIHGSPGTASFSRNTQITESSRLTRILGLGKNRVTWNSC